MDYPLPPWLTPQAAQGWGELAGQAARTRLNAQLEQQRMQQQSAQFAIEASQRSAQAAQENQMRQDALNYDHQVEQQKIAIEQNYKQQQLSLQQQDEQLAQQQFAAKTADAAKKFAAQQAFQKAILPKDQGGEGLPATEAALKYLSGSMTGTEVGRLAGQTGNKDEYSPGATMIVPGGATMINTGGKRWQVLPQAPPTITAPPEPMSVTNSAGKYIGDVIQLPGQKPVFHPTGNTKESPMDVLRERQQQGQKPADKKAPDKKAPDYKTKDDVVKAFKDGKLTRDEAAKLLNKQFGVPLQ